jgi:hypothetical protein
LHNHKTTRRQFTRNLVALASAPLLGKAGAVRAADEQPPDPVTAASDALGEIARIRFGSFVTDDQLKAVKQSIRQSQNSAQFLKRSKLHNSDEPSFIFRADLP